MNVSINSKQDSFKITYESKQEKQSVIESLSFALAQFSEKDSNMLNVLTEGETSDLETTLSFSDAEKYFSQLLNLSVVLSNKIKENQILENIVSLTKDLVQNQAMLNVLTEQQEKEGTE